MNDELQVLKNKKLKTDTTWKEPTPFPEITVYRESEKEEIKENYVKKIRVKEPVNLTRKINETAKLVKEENASDKLEQLKEILNKE